MLLFTVLGLKWFDKINGNTYCSSVIVCPDGKEIYTDYQYGYGSYYLHAAEERVKAYIKETGLNRSQGYAGYKLHDLGSYYTKKANVKGHIIA